MESFLDHEYLKANIFDEGIESLLAEMLETDAGSGKHLIERIKEAVLAEDMKGVEFLAHRLKGASGAVGAARMFEVSAAIEEAAAAGRVGEAGALAGSLEEIFTGTVGELRKLL